MMVWIDGGFVPLKEACVPILSHGFSRGVVIFDTLKVTSTEKGPAILALDAHIERFFDSAQRLHLRLPLNQEEMMEATKEAARINGVESGVCKSYAYYADAFWGTLPPDDSTCTVAICCGSHADFGFDKSKKKKALDIGISSYRKLHKDSVPIKAKVTGYYVGAYLSALEAKSRGFDEALMADTDDYLCEGGYFSIFLIIDGVLTTPPLDRVLVGTTRTMVMEVARDIGIPMEERDLKIQDLGRVDEAFCASSVSGLVPVRSLEDHILGSCCPGPITQKVFQAMEKVSIGQSPAHKHLLTYLNP